MTTRSIISCFFMVALAMLATACGSDLPKYADKMDSVKVKTIVQSQTPSIDMNDNTNHGSSGIGQMIDTANAVTGMAAAVKVKNKFNRTINPRYVNTQTQSAFFTQLADGPPFAAAEDAKDGHIDLQVIQWGMRNKDGTPVFTFTLRPDVFYKNKEDAIYDAQFTCDPTGVWEWTNGGSEIAESIQAMKAIEKMSDEKFVAAFDRSLDQCAKRLVGRLQEAAKP